MIAMKPADNLNNLSQMPCGSALDSTTENNSESSDVDADELGTGAGDKKRIVQGRNQTKINDLATRLTIADIQLASEKEKNKDKADVIKSLKLSINVITQSKDLIIKSLQSQLIELQTALDLSKSQMETKDKSGQNLTKSEGGEHTTKVDELIADIELLECKLKSRNQKLSELDDTVMKYERNLKEKDDHIAKLECQIKLALDATQKYERNLKEKDEHIAKLESQAKTDAARIKQVEGKLSKFTLKDEPSQLDSNSRVFLNCTKVPSVQFVTLPKTGRFLAVFEDLPSAGPDWMVVQRRVNGAVAFHAKCDQAFRGGFGDLGGEFWLGCDKLHELTTLTRYELYIELVDFDNAKAFARYDHFVVGSQAEKYNLKRLGQYSGNAGDYLRNSENNDFMVTKVIQTMFTSHVFFGWWSRAECNLNGQYYNQKTILESDDCIWWGLWNMGGRHSLKSCKMLIRPRPDPNL